MAEFDTNSRSKSRLDMLCMGNLSISAHLRCANKTNARNVNLFAAHLRSANQEVV